MAVTITMQELGEELKRKREKTDLSLRDVQDATGVSAATLSRIERGSTPDLEVVKKLANWLGVTVQAGGEDLPRTNTDAELKRSIEVHLRANKKLSANLARSIADSFDVVMRVELQRAASKRKG
jgi:transcriptional regulator with XRE-family HTH domain